MANQNQAICICSVHHQRIAKLLFVMFAATALMIAFCSSIAGQETAAYTQTEILADYRMESESPRLKQDNKGNPFYEELTDDEKKTISADNRTKKSKISDDSKRIDAILQSGGGLDQPLVKDFFDGNVFAEMTQTSEEKISILGELRSKFFKDYLSKKVAGSKREQFLDTVLIPSLRKIINNDNLQNANKENYHPAVRLNAVYMLGMLDLQVADRLTNQTPIPSAAAFGDLVKIYNSDQFPAYLKVAALAGIERHIEIDSVVGGQIPENEKQKLLADATNVLTGKAAGQDGWEKELDYWLKRRSMHILGWLKQASSLDTILTVLNADDSGMWLQFDALEAIGRLDLTAVPAAKVAETSLAITENLAKSFENESKTINASVAKLIYDNMLFQDLDLEATGTKYDTPATGGLAGGPDMGMGRGRGGMGPPGGGNMGPPGGEGIGADSSLGGAGLGGAGLGGFGGPSGGRGGVGGPLDGGLGGGAPSTEDPNAKPLVELPNYQLHASRRRIKAFAYTGKSLLKFEGKGLRILADQDGQNFIDQVVSELDLILDSSNIGIIDLDAKKPEPLADEEDKKSVTFQLADMCAKTALNLNKKIRDQKGEDPNPLADPATPADPASPGEPAGDKKDSGFDFGN